MRIAALLTIILIAAGCATVNPAAAAPVTYRSRAVVTPDRDPAFYKVAFTVEQDRGNGWELFVDPALVVYEGCEATCRITAGGRELSFTALVEAENGRLHTRTAVEMVRPGQAFFVHSEEHSAPGLCLSPCTQPLPAYNTGVL